MGFDKSYYGLDAYAIQLIRCKVAKLIRGPEFGTEEREELERELAIHLVCALPQFDPQRAQLRTFVTRVVDHKATDWIRTRKAVKRGGGETRHVPLDEPMGERTDNPTNPSESLDEEHYLRVTGRLAMPGEMIRDLSIDLERALAELPPRLAALARELMSGNVSEASRRMGKPRSTINDDVRRLRTFLEDRGLRDYL